MEQQLEKSAYAFNTEQRRYDDATTWLAEMLDGQMRTPFEYSFDGHELFASDGGALEPIFTASLQQTSELPAELSFEARRRTIELEEYHAMTAMMKDELPNTMVVVSDFPEELRHASKDVGGYNVERQQTMLRVITKTKQGTLVMRSQSLDKSNRQGLEAIYNSLDFAAQPGELLGQRMHLELDEINQEFLVDNLMSVYDASLSSQFGGNWRAGRPEPHRPNTYSFACAQTDLINLYQEAEQSGMADDSFMYALAATMQKRYSQLTHVDEAYTVPSVAPQQLVQEMLVASKEAKRAGTTFSGCGMSVSSEEQGVEEQLSALGFGNKSEEDKYGPLKFKCPKGHWNKRKPARSPKDFLPKCKTCSTSLKC